MADIDPLDGDRRLIDYFGAAWPQVRAFHDLLAGESTLRGLLGPREMSRLWERHLLNSAAVVPFVSRAGSIVDVGSGAGLPGVVVAAMVPAATVTLVEPMERRASWLGFVLGELELDNAVVRRARAEELVGELAADAVVARAVAPLERLFRWTGPLLRPGGVLVALKGAQAEREVAAAASAAREAGLGAVEVHEAPTLPGLEATRAVVARRVTHGAR